MKITKVSIPQLGVSISLNITGTFNYFTQIAEMTLFSILIHVWITPYKLSLICVLRTIVH